MANSLNLLRQAVHWTMRLSGRRAVHTTLRFLGASALDRAVQLGGQTALDRAATVLPLNQQQSLTHVFTVKPGHTVYVRASHCRVLVQRHAEPRVSIQSTMVRSFGLELAAEQDDNGVYVVARRKPVVGQVAGIELTLTVPDDCHLAFNLTPGDVVLRGIDGVIELPARPDVSEQAGADAATFGTVDT